MNKANLFANVLKKFFTGLRDCENNRVTRMEGSMNYALKTMFAKDHGAVEDAAGLIALCVLLVAVLSLPGLA